MGLGGEIGYMGFIHINAGLSEISVYIYASDNALLRRVCDICKTQKDGLGTTRKDAGVFMSFVGWSRPKAIRTEILAEWRGGCCGCGEKDVTLHLKTSCAQCARIKANINTTQ